MMIEDDVKVKPLEKYVAMRCSWAVIQIRRPQKKQKKR